MWGGGGRRVRERRVWGVGGRGAHEGGEEGGGVGGLVWGLGGSGGGAGGWSGPGAEGGMGGLGVLGTDRPGCLGGAGSGEKPPRVGDPPDRFASACSTPGRVEGFTRARWSRVGQRRLLAPRRVRGALLGGVRLCTRFAGEPSSYKETRILSPAEQARGALQVHRSSRPRTSAVAFARCIAASFDSWQD